MLCYRQSYYILPLKIRDVLNQILHRLFDILVLNSRGKSISVTIVLEGWEVSFTRLVYGFVLLYTLIDFLRTSVKTLKVALELESTAVESL